MHMQHTATDKICGILPDTPAIEQLIAEFCDYSVLTLPCLDFYSCLLQATNTVRHNYLGPLFSSVLHTITYSERPLPLLEAFQHFLDCNLYKVPRGIKDTPKAGARAGEHVAGKLQSAAGSLRFLLRKKGFSMAASFVSL